jgi:hypothetical protein
MTAMTAMTTVTTVGDDGHLHLRHGEAENSSHAVAAGDGGGGVRARVVRSSKGRMTCSALFAVAIWASWLCGNATTMEMTTTTTMMIG